MSKARTEKKQSATEERAARLKDLVALLRRPNELLEPVDMPKELVPAFATCRPELLALAAPRAMPSEEVAKLFKLIQVLMETNMALQGHAQTVAEMADHMMSQFKGLTSSLLRLEAYASFTSADDASDDEAEG